jgi:hypothetical protein
VTAAEVWELLERGGLRVEPAASLPDVAESGTVPARVSTYDALRDPQGAARLGALLAERARLAGPGVVVVWEDLTDAILGFLVAHNLGVPVVRVRDADGLAEPDATFPHRSRAVLVGDAFAGDHEVLAIVALLELYGGVLAAVVPLVDLRVTSIPVPVHALVSAERRA